MKTMRMAVSFGLLFGLILTVGCEPAPGTALVSIQLAADIQERDRLATLEIVVEAAGVHHAGLPITAGWANWLAEPLRVDLVSISPGETLDLEAGVVPAGAYDRVRIVAEAGRAEEPDGTPVPLAFDIEPIAIPLELRNQDNIRITIELIALADTNGNYHLFTKSAAISR